MLSELKINKAKQVGAASPSYIQGQKELKRLSDVALRYPIPLTWSLTALISRPFPGIIKFPFGSTREGNSPLFCDSVE